MRRRTRGQSIVEMALLLPVMLVVLFGIIDLSWYIYGYSTVYMASRAGAEEATMLPPGESKVGVGVSPDMSDPCVSTIVNNMRRIAPLFGDFAQAEHIEISYPNGTRIEGAPIQVKVDYDITPLTPLWRLVPVFGESGVLNVTVTTRRTIEVLGLNPQNRYAPNLSACN